GPAAEHDHAALAEIALDFLAFPQGAGLGIRQGAPRLEARRQSCCGFRTLQGELRLKLIDPHRPDCNLRVCGATVYYETRGGFRTGSLLATPPAPAAKGSASGCVPP